MGWVVWAFVVASVASGGAAVIYPDKPNEVLFPEVETKFVRLVIHAASSSTQPCIDEMEVYAQGPDSGRNLALAKEGAKASASSCLPGYTQHRIAHLNDGQYGNSYSWIPEGASKEWAQIELSQVAKVSRVVLSRDRTGQHSDRVPMDFEVLVSMDGREWRSVRRIEGSVAVVAAGRAIQGPEPLLPPAPPPPRAGNRPLPESVGGAASLNAVRQDELGFANLALNPSAKANASSVYMDGRLAIHQVRHLNDGLLGNSHSWISRQEPSWAEIDLGEVYWVWKVAFGSDSLQQYSDRAATTFSILAACEYERESKARVWTVVYRHTSGEPVHIRREHKFQPVCARWIRLVIDTASAGQVRIDEVEVFGQKDAISAARIGPVAAAPTTEPAGGLARPEMEEQLRYAFLGEEHALLKTYGRADLDGRLVPYNGRVKEYPRHVGDDCLPLPGIPTEPKLDGRLDDACWQDASRGVVRVAYPYDFKKGPLAEHEVYAGVKGESLFVAVRASELLSTHIAVVSAGDWRGCGVVARTKDGFVFNTYKIKDRAKKQVELDKTLPVDASVDDEFGCCEIRLPLGLFPGCERTGLRVGVGLGGKHTSPLGRPVTFTKSALALAEQLPCSKGVFVVRVRVPRGSDRATLVTNVPGLGEAFTLEPGGTRTLAIPAKRGALGPEFKLEVSEASGRSYRLHLFRYDPLERALVQTGEMADRFAAKGLNVESERKELARFRVQQERLLAAPPSMAEERAAFFEARLAKRKLFLRDSDLGAISSILFVKRQAFHPSHIYTDYTDAPFRPGGAVCVLGIPSLGGRFEPGQAKVTALFEAGGGIARDPVASYDCGKVYFGYRPSAGGYYHVMRMNADGTALQQLTDGPFHDFYPCPLPDGGVAFISTRCTARVFCFRGGSSVLFRMNSDGKGIRPLSFASLSEWAPSVMTDGRIIWTRWEYVDKGADFSQTLWAIRPDGSYPELVFGNTIIQPNGYACGREVPAPSDGARTREISCTLVSQFGDINGPIALLDITKGRFNPEAITSITPEVPWPGMWPAEECFRDPLPLARDYFLCAHAPRNRFGLYVIDRFGNREILYLDPAICSMGPTPFRVAAPPPVLAGSPDLGAARGQFVLMDVYQGISPPVKRGDVRYIRVVEEVRHEIELLPGGEYRKDHPVFMHWYATPVDKVRGPFGWPAYVAKAPLGIVPVEEDGLAYFSAPAGKHLYFQALDKDFNELQRMRSVVQLQPGETRSCVGCHEERFKAPPVRTPLAVRRPPSELQPPSWGAARPPDGLADAARRTSDAGPFSYEKVVQPVLDAKCVNCHKAEDPGQLDLRGVLDMDRIPASYKALILRGLVNHVDCGFNSGRCEKHEPLTFGTLKSRLWEVLKDENHREVNLTADEMIRIKTWTDLNCPLWPDYVERYKRPGPPVSLTQSR